MTWANRKRQLRKVNKKTVESLRQCIVDGKIDWIETDGFLEYFDATKLSDLLDVWAKLLKRDGFITLREFASVGFFGKLVDVVRIWITKRWLEVKLYKHSKEALQRMFQKHQFRFVSGATLLPTFLRYALVPKI